MHAAPGASAKRAHQRTLASWGGGQEPRQHIFVVKESEGLCVIVSWRAHALCVHYIGDCVTNFCTALSRVHRHSRPSPKTLRYPYICTKVCQWSSRRRGSCRPTSSGAVSVCVSVRGGWLRVSCVAGWLVVGLALVCAFVCAFVSVCPVLDEIHKVRSYTIDWPGRRREHRPPNPQTDIWNLWTTLPRAPPRGPRPRVGAGRLSRACARGDVSVSRRLLTAGSVRSCTARAPKRLTQAYVDHQWASCLGNRANQHSRK